MLDPEITCQADNIRPELIRDLQSVVATFLPAPRTSLPWDQDRVVPVHFARGAVRPDPAGRAFCVLLRCAAEGLSAQRFAEYLSLGQVSTRHRTLDTYQLVSTFTV